MSNGHADQVVIKKKRRRIAVDPCLGYYENNTTSSLTPVSLEYSKDNVEQHGIHGYGRQEIGDSSDSVPPITSLQSSDDHNVDFVTVEGFLRQRATAGVTRNKKTYSRRTRIIQSSPDVEAENRTVENESGVVPQIPQTRSNEKRPESKRKARKAPRGSKKSSTKRRVPFTKRIQQAAALASVEMDMDAPHTVPLQLVPRDQAPSRTPPRERRARLIDPRIPRRLDTSFANKENTSPRDETKCFRPFLQWSCPCPQTTNPPYSSPLISRTAPRDRAIRDPRTPLDLVPYDEHDLARSAKFDRKWFRKCPRMKSPLVLEPQPQCSVPIDSQINVNDDPFKSLPLTAESRPGESSQVGANDTPRIPLENTSNDTIYNFTPLSLEAPALDILVPRSSQSPSPRPANSTTQKTAKSTDDTVTFNAQVGYSSDDTLGSVTARTLTRSRSMHVPQLTRSQKPMRRIGTMLDGFRETARNFLLSQAQVCLDQPVLNSSKPGTTAIAVPRCSSRRLVCSSPVRYSPETLSEARKESTLRETERIWDGSKECAQVATTDRVGRSTKKVRKSISTPPVSVSAFLGSDITRGEEELQCDRDEDHPAEDMAQTHVPPESTPARFHHGPLYPSLSRTHPAVQQNSTNLLPEESRQRLDIGVNPTVSLTALQEHAASFDTNRPPLPPPTLFEYRDGFAPLNLFDLLEGAEPYNGAQIVLSPCL